MLSRLLQVSLGRSFGVNLRPGQAFQAVVQRGGDGLYLQLGRARVPLPADAGLAPGTPVRAEAVNTPEGPRLQVTPAPSQAAAAAEALPQALIGRVLAQIDALPFAQQASAMLPVHISPRETIVRQLFALLLGRGSLGADLEQLGPLLSEAVAQGALPPELQERFAALFARNAGDTGALHALMERLAAGQRPEARLARGGSEADLQALRQDLRALLGELRDHLRSSKQAEAFETLFARVTDRLDGARHQNLHALRQDYVFMELPLRPDEGFQRAQLHFFPKGVREDGPKDAAVALDLELSRLGSLWIWLRTHGRACECHLRAREAATVSALEAAAEELRAALAEAQGTATVRVTSWDGDRAGELVAVARQLTGIRLHA